MGIVTMEQKISEQARDIELKDIKIESLENIIRRRDQQQVDHSSQIVAALEDKVSGLEGDREKLIKDNISLIRQIDHYKEEIERQKKMANDKHRANELKIKVRHFDIKFKQSLEERGQQMERQIE